MLDEGLRIQNMIDRTEAIGPEAALERYRAAFPELVSGSPSVTVRNYRVAVDIAATLQRTEQPEAADALLAGAWDATRGLAYFGHYGRGIVDAEILALQGQTLNALKALEDAVKAGWRFRWWLWTDLNPNLDGLKDMSRFQTIIAELDRDMARQLSEIRLLDSHGELAPLPSWPVSVE